MAARLRIDSLKDWRPALDGPHPSYADDQHDQIPVIKACSSDITTHRHIKRWSSGTSWCIVLAGLKARADHFGHTLAASEDYDSTILLPAKEVENQTENFGAPLSPSDPASRAQMAVHGNMITYLAKIAIVLQDAPKKMLTFTQLLDKLTLVFSEDRKSIENNIRVCLSTNKCFVKVPIVPSALNSKRNYWKLDLTQITAKMARRHFRDLLQQFPDLAFMLRKENKPSQRHSTPNSSELEAHKADRIQREVKFRGPFSIESLLKADHSAREPRASPLFTVPLRVEQQPYCAPCTHAGTKRSFSWNSEAPLTLQNAAISSPIYSAEGGRYFECGAIQPIKRMPAYPDPTAYPTASAPYFTTPHVTYITSVPTFARGFWL